MQKSLLLTLLFVGLFVTGCGFKKAPVYVENKVEKTK
jgi:outer membrane lipoprotein-sorting protein